MCVYVHTVVHIYVHDNGMFDCRSQLSTTDFTTHTRNSTQTYNHSGDSIEEVYNYVAVR